VRQHFAHVVTFGRGGSKVVEHVLNGARHQASGNMCVGPKSVRQDLKLVVLSKVGLFGLPIKSLIEVTKVDQKS
jgi:hypothetical protein